MSTPLWIPSRRQRAVRALDEVIGQTILMDARRVPVGRALERLRRYRPDLIRDVSLLRSADIRDHVWFWRPA